MPKFTVRNPFKAFANRASKKNNPDISELADTNFEQTMFVDGREYKLGCEMNVLEGKLDIDCDLTKVKES